MGDLRKFVKKKVSKIEGKKVSISDFQDLEDL